MGKEGTALGVARERFVDGLPRKSKELKASIALLVATPDADRPREEMRRRLHALYASAQVFRIEPLAAALKERITALDAARDAGKELPQEELDALANLATTLPMLGRAGGGRSSSPSIAAPRPPSSRPPPPEPALQPLPPPPTLSEAAPEVRQPLPPPPPAPSEPPVEAPDEATAPAEPEEDDEDAPTIELDRLDAPDAPSEPPPRKRKRVSTADITDEVDADRKRDPKPYVPPSPGDVKARKRRKKRTTSRGIGLGETDVESEPSAKKGRRRRASFSMGKSGRSRPSTIPGEPLEMIVSVLVVDGVESQAAIREALPRDRFEVLGASDPEQALRLARSSGPDVVLADAQLTLGEADLISRLRSDPLTDFVPVVILHDAGAPVDADEMRERGADAVMQKPATAKALQRLVDRLAGAGVELAPGADLHGERTIEEVADQLAREIRRGIVEAAAAGQDLRVSLGDGSEVLAAAWATIARVRAELAERSGGRIKFRDGASRGGPAFMSLIDEAIGEGSDQEVSLEGRRVIVADDDPAVVWFFAGLLREAGAYVVEVDDGRAALDAARYRRPDVVLSDILMPRMDGLALCRELARDPALAEVPVILLSWKEDFLQRMRELRSGASGYLRKEAESGQILHKVREVLRPRARLESQLKAGGEVRGRVEGLGVLPLLRTTTSLQPDARVTVRDAWNLFEVEIRGGLLLDVTRTASDGSFARGSRALPQLLGVTAGRFTVTDSDTEVRASLSGAVDETLDEAARKLGAFVDAVSGRRLASAHRVGFDEVLLQVFLRTSPGGVRGIVEQLADGGSPREILVGGEVSPQALETALVDLARRGAVTSVTGEEGEDLVADALEARTIPKTGPSTMPPPAGHVSEDDEDEGGLLVAPTNPPPDAPAAGEEDEDRDSEIEELMEAALVRPEEGAKPEAKGEAKEEALADAGPTPEPDEEDEDEDDEDEDDDEDDDDSDSDDGDDDDSDEDDDDDSDEDDDEDRRVRAVATSSPTAPSEEGGLGALGWGVLLLLLATAAFFGWRALRGGPPSDAPAPTEDDAPTEPIGDETTDTEDPAAAVAPDPGERPELSFGRSVTRVLDAGVPVADGQGLLWIQEGASETDITVRPRSGDGSEAEPRPLGAAPVAVALEEGEYEVVFQRDGTTHRRFVFLRAGHTRVVRPE